METNVELMRERGELRGRGYRREGRVKHAAWERRYGLVRRGRRWRWKPLR